MLVCPAEASHPIIAISLLVYLVYLPLLCFMFTSYRFLHILKVPPPVFACFCYGVIAPPTGLACVLHRFQAYQVNSCGRTHLLKQLRLYEERF